MRKAATIESIIGSGMRCLASGKAFQAMGLFRRAVDAIEPSNRPLLHRALYWLSVSALRLGRRDIAVKALTSAGRLDRHGHAACLRDRFGNGYGMPRQATPAEDDRLAFFSIQVGRYLRLCPKREFSGAPERDMVLALIASAWSDLCRSRVLEDMSLAHKAEYFRTLRLDFPRFGASAPSEHQVIGVDFRLKARLAADARCPCGSGRPLALCCGASGPQVTLG